MSQMFTGYSKGEVNCRGFGRACIGRPVVQCNYTTDRCSLRKIVPAQQPYSSTSSHVTTPSSPASTKVKASESVTLYSHTTPTVNNVIASFMITNSSNTVSSFAGSTSTGEKTAVAATFGENVGTNVTSATESEGSTSDVSEAASDSANMTHAPKKMTSTHETITTVADGSSTPGGKVTPPGDSFEGKYDLTTGDNAQTSSSDTEATTLNGNSSVSLFKALIKSTLSVKLNDIVPHTQTSETSASVTALRTEGSESSKYMDGPGTTTAERRSTTTVSENTTQNGETATQICSIKTIQICENQTNPVPNGKIFWANAEKEIQSLRSPLIVCENMNLTWRDWTKMDCLTSHIAIGLTASVVVMTVFALIALSDIFQFCV